MYLTDNPKAIPLKFTLGTVPYKNLLNNKFDVLFNNTQILFKNMDITPNTIEIGNNVFKIEDNLLYVNSKYILPIPKTIGDFIEMCNNMDIDIYWTELVTDTLEPKDFLEQNKIRTYYEELLTIMDKSEELL